MKDLTRGRGGSFPASCLVATYPVMYTYKDYIHKRDPETLKLKELLGIK